jgi:hypothetical protein
MAETEAGRGSLRRLRSCALPGGEGLLHSVVTDTAGNLYCSDETNHAVFSLEALGRVRWRRGAPGDFHYPRGIAIGKWVCGGGEFLECLAVCDSWNGRVQVLDLEGNALASWNRASGIPLGEVADVRYMAGGIPGVAGNTAGVWLLLDRGEHALYALKPDGSVLARTGRCLPNSLANRWAVPTTFFVEESAAEAAADFPPLDFLFHPDRMIGGPVVVYVSEPRFGLLKRVAWPHLLPIRVAQREPLEWITAGASGMVGWRRASGELWLFDGAGTLCATKNLQGVPVPTDRDGEFWIRGKEDIELWQWLPPVGAPATSGPRFEGTAAAEFAQFDLTAVQSSVAACISAVDEILSIALQITDAAGSLDADWLRHLAVCVPMLKDRRLLALRALNESLHHWSLGMMAARLEAADTDTAWEVAPDLRDWRAYFLRQVRYQFGQIRVRLEKLSEAVSETRSGDPAMLELWRSAAAAARLDLLDTRQWLRTWSGQPPDAA